MSTALFVVSKLVGGLFHPVTLLLIALLLALWWRQRRPVASRALLAAAALVLAAVTLMPAAWWLIAPLERRFPAAPPPAQVDGIIVLGGAIDGSAVGPAYPPSMNGAGERLVALAMLARRYPDARLVFTGGSGLVRDQSHPEADLVPPLMAALGIDPRRLIVERDSRNTWENAVDARRLAQPRPGQTWLLVTSAWHMPRSVGCFRAAGWPVRAYPVDYMGSETQGWLAFDAESELVTAAYAIKEWIGLLAYHVLGRTDAWFPAP